MSRWLIRLTLVTVLALAALATAALLSPTSAVRFGLALGGVQNVRVGAVALDLAALELTDLELGPRPDHRVDRLRIGYRWPDILFGRLTTIDLDGAVVRLRHTTDGHLEVAGFEGETTGAAAGPVVLPPLPEQMAIRRSRLVLDSPLGALTLPLRADLRPSASGIDVAITVAGADLRQSTGSITADLDFEGALTLGTSDWQNRLSGSGNLTLAATDLAIDRFAQGVGGRAQIGLDLAGGELTVDLTDLAVDVAALAPGLGQLDQLAPTPWQVGSIDPDAAIRITAAPVPDGVATTFAGGISLVTAGPTLQAEVGNGTARVSAGQVTRGQAEVRLALAELTLAMSAGATIQGGGFEGTLDLDLDPNHLRVGVATEARLTARALAWQDSVVPDGLALLVQPGEIPLVVAEIVDGVVSAWNLAAAAQLGATKVEIATADGRMPLTVAADRLAVTADGTPEGLGGARLALTGGRAELPTAGFRADGLATDLTLTATGLAPGPIPFTVGALSHTVTPTWFAPLALDGTATPDGDAIGFTATVRQPGRAVEVRIDGRHDLVTGQGQAAVDLPTITFDPAGLQPARLAPFLGRTVADVAGRVAAAGTLRWRPDADPTGKVELLVEELGLTAGPARLEQVNGVIRLDQIRPLTTPPGQQLAIGLLDFGLPLTDGLIDFHLPGNDDLAIEGLRWNFAGGRVSAAPFTVGSAAQAFTVTLSAEGLDLAQLFALTRLDGLTGEGVIHGTLPVRITGTEASIEGGELRAAGPGWLRYEPTAAPGALQAGGSGASLLLEALENFHYEALRITLDGRTDDEMDIGLHLAGANPDLYDGYPIEFNLNLEGQLANVLRSGLASYQIPDRIRERMQGFAR